jgi:hypothetical protein
VLEGEDQETIEGGKVEQSESDPILVLLELVVKTNRKFNIKKHWIEHR